MGPYLGNLSKWWCLGKKNLGNISKWWCLGKTVYWNKVIFGRPHKGHVENNEAKVWQNGHATWKMKTYQSRINVPDVIFLADFVIFNMTHKEYLLYHAGRSHYSVQLVPHSVHSPLLDMWGPLDTIANYNSCTNSPALCVHYSSVWVASSKQTDKRHGMTILPRV